MKKILGYFVWLFSFGFVVALVCVLAAVVINSIYVQPLKMRYLGFNMPVYAEEAIPYKGTCTIQELSDGTLNFHLSVGTHEVVYEPGGTAKFVYLMGFPAFKVNSISSKVIRKGDFTSIFKLTESGSYIVDVGSGYVYGTVYPGNKFACPP